MDPKDTASAETVSVPTPESTATPQAPDSAVVEPAKVDQPQVDTEDVETLRKRLEQTEMERNLLKNKEEKRKQKDEEARLAELSETDRLREELAELKQKESQSAAEKLRNDAVEEALKDDPDSLKAIKSLMDKGLVSIGWDDAETVDDAKAQVFAQVKALKDVVGSAAKPADPSAPVNPNNPAPLGEPQADRSKLLEEAARTGNFDKLLQNLPSVAAQIRKMKGEE